MPLTLYSSARFSGATSSLRVISFCALRSSSLNSPRDACDGETQAWAFKIQVLPFQMMMQQVLVIATCRYSGLACHKYLIIIAACYCQTGSQGPVPVRLNNPTNPSVTHRHGLLHCADLLLLGGP